MTPLPQSGQPIGGRRPLRKGRAWREADHPRGRGGMFVTLDGVGYANRQEVGRAMSRKSDTAIAAHVARGDDHYDAAKREQRRRQEGGTRRPSAARRGGAPRMREHQTLKGTSSVDSDQDARYAQADFAAMPMGSRKKAGVSWVHRNTGGDFTVKHPDGSERHLTSARGAAGEAKAYSDRAKGKSSRGPRAKPAKDAGPKRRPDAKTPAQRRADNARRKARGLPPRLHGTGVGW